ncbi:DUF3857 domain-containing protein [Moheibacter lacus]|uniref:DUF3857 domain-containing protein n=1 Tax=Moheibacter lacus TaxID=2745851 RepID=A0A838ZRT3_9FLAO|nr:DUF3857 domain-containing protein [Moheibacter lacus]MBA5628509.1 DUF3857 domain-containing protein [Moheibacter lacus]
MKFNISLFSLFFSIICFAQLNPKTKWGEVSQAEIDYKKVSYEPDAGAVILYEEGKTIISGSFQTKVYRRIKILNEKGIDAANQQLTFYAEKNKEKIEGLKAQTLNIENGQVKAYPVEKNSIFDINLNEFYGAKKFTFPNVKVGSILEFEYDFYDENAYLIDAWRFQHEHPTLFSQYSLTNETHREYASLMVGEKIVQQSKNNKSKDASKWTLTNLTSYSSIPYLYNPADMAEGIILQLMGYFTDSKGAFSEIVFKEAISNWADVSKELQNYYNGFANAGFGKEIANSIPNGNSEKATIENVHQYMKQNYKWNNYQALYPRKTNKEVEKDKTGYSADLNILLNSILKGKGLKAELVIISTRDNGKLIINYPYLGQFNTIVNMISLKDGSVIYMDASDLSNGLGFMPLRDYNHYGLILNSKDNNFANLTQPISEFSSVQLYNFKENQFILSRNDKANGYFLQQQKKEALPKGQEQYHEVKNALDLLMNETKKDSKMAEDGTRMERTFYESAPIQSQNFFTIENPLKSTVSFFKLSENTRERALEFNFPFYYKTDVIIPIPDGYEVQIPQDFQSNHSASRKELNYYQTAEVKDNKVILHVEFIVTKPAFSYGYKEIKSFFEKVNLDASKTILMKKS